MCSNFIQLKVDGKFVALTNKYIELKIMQKGAMDILSARVDNFKYS